MVITTKSCPFSSQSDCVYYCSHLIKYLLSSFLVDGTVTLPSTEREYTTGRDPRVACTVSGETFDSWITPSGQRITNLTAGRITVTVTGDAYTLKIDSVTAQDGGVYRCQGSSNSQPFTLIVNCKYLTN